MSWYCSCGCLNSGLTTVCAFVKSRNEPLENHYQISVNSLDELRIIVALKELDKPMTDKEELFAKYYNGGRVLVKDMNDSELREHWDSLVKIATEAKAHVQAASDEIRERDAKRRVKDKEWLTTVDHDKATSDALNNVKTRTARMSKLDKMQKDLLAMGMDEKIVKEMIANMSKAATEQQVKTVTFKTPTTEVTAISIKKTESGGKPFDVSKISFGK